MPLAKDDKILKRHPAEFQIHAINSVEKSMTNKGYKFTFVRRNMRGSLAI